MGRGEMQQRISRGWGYDGGRAATLWCRSGARWGLRKEGTRMRVLGLRRWAGLAVLVCGLAAWGQNYTPVTVVVTGPDGVLAGAAIRVTPGSPAGDTLITDEPGRAQLGIPAGEYTLHVTAQGFVGADKALVVADKAQTLTVALEVAPASSGGTEAGPAPMSPGAVPLETTQGAGHAASVGAASASATTLTIVGANGERGVFTPQTLREYPQKTVKVMDRRTSQEKTY